MTDDLESNSVEGSAGSPNSAVSQDQSVSSTSTPDASKQPEQLESLVSKAVEKALQSQKDKRFSNIEKTLDGFKPVLEQVKNMLTPEQLKEFNQIQKDAEFEQLKQAVYGNTQNSTPANGTQKSTANFETQNILKEYALDGNDPEVIEQVIKKDFANETEAKLAAANLAFRRANPTPPNIGAASTPVGSSAKTGLSDAETESKYAELRDLLKNPSQNSSKIQNIKKELSDAGHPL